MRRTLPVIPPEIRDDGIPGGAMSYSKYSAFKACAKAFEFTYIHGIKGPPSLSMVKGIAIHAGAESALRAKKEGQEFSLAQGVAAVSDAYDAEKGDAPEDPTASKDSAILLYKLYHAQTLPHLEPLEIEQEFVVKVGTVPALGYIDLLDGAGEKVTVVDLKTSTAKWSERDVRLEPQLTLYAAVKGTTFARIDNLVSTKTPAYHRLETTRLSADVKVFIEDFEETVDLIKRGIFPRTSIDSWKCDPKWCVHWSACRGRGR